MLRAQARVHEHRTPVFPRLATAVAPLTLGPTRTAPQWCIAARRSAAHSPTSHRAAPHWDSTASASASPASGQIECAADVAGTACPSTVSLPRLPPSWSIVARPASTRVSQPMITGANTRVLSCLSWRGALSLSLCLLCCQYCSVTTVGPLASERADASLVQGPACWSKGQAAVNRGRQPVHINQELPLRSAMAQRVQQGVDGRCPEQGLGRAEPVHVI